MTRAQAWDATPVVVAPRRVSTMPGGIRLTRIRDNGTVVVRQIRFHASRALTGNTVYLVEDETVLLVFDDKAR
jgi:putative transposase